MTLEPPVEVICVRRRCCRHPLTPPPLLLLVSASSSPEPPQYAARHTGQSCLSIMNHVVKHRPWKLCWHALSETTSSASHRNGLPSSLGIGPGVSVFSSLVAGGAPFAVGFLATTTPALSPASVVVVAPACSIGTRLNSSPMHMGHSGSSCDAPASGASISSTTLCNFFLALLYALAAGL